MIPVLVVTKIGSEGQSLQQRYSSNKNLWWLGRTCVRFLVLPKSPLGAFRSLSVLVTVKQEVRESGDINKKPFGDLNTIWMLVACVPYLSFAWLMNTSSAENCPLS